MNHYDSNYAANLDRDDEEDPPILCVRCGDQDAHNPLHGGRQVCVGCVFDICDELLRERDKAVGPAIKEMGRKVKDALDCSGVLRIHFGPAFARAFLAELEAKP